MKRSRRLRTKLFNPVCDVSLRSTRPHQNTATVAQNRAANHRERKQLCNRLSALPDSAAVNKGRTDLFSFFFINNRTCWSEGGERRSVPGEGGVGRGEGRALELEPELERVAKARVPGANCTCRKQEGGSSSHEPAHGSTRLTQL